MTRCVEWLFSCFSFDSSIKHINTKGISFRLKFHSLLRWSRSIINSLLYIDIILSTFSSFREISVTCTNMHMRTHACIFHNGRLYSSAVTKLEWARRKVHPPLHDYHFLPPCPPTTERTHISIYIHSFTFFFYCYCYSLPYSEFEPCPAHCLVHKVNNRKDWMRKRKSEREKSKQYNIEICSLFKYEWKSERINVRSLKGKNFINDQLNFL